MSLDFISDYEKYFVDYEVIRHLSASVPWPYPKDGVRNFVEKGILPNLGVDRWMWGLFLKEKPDELIGAVDLWQEGRPEHRGFWLGHKFWGRGLMTEAVNPVNEYAFKSLGFEKMIFTNAVGNKQSRRIKEKTGALLIAVKPAKFVDPKYTEHEIWELTKESWKKFNSGTA